MVSFGLIFFGVLIWSWIDDMWNVPTGMSISPSRGAADITSVGRQLLLLRDRGQQLFITTFGRVRKRSWSIKGETVPLCTFSEPSIARSDLERDGSNPPRTDICNAECSPISPAYACSVGVRNTSTTSISVLNVYILDHTISRDNLQRPLRVLHPVLLKYHIRRLPRLRLRRAFTAAEPEHQYKSPTRHGNPVPASTNTPFRL